VTDTTAGAGADDPAGTAKRMAAIAAGLHAAGLDARVHDTRGVLDVTATLHRPGCKDIDLTVDEDHYVQVSYWDGPGATPAQVVATVSRALAAITAPP
jgi:hypothetical protein